MIIVEQDVTKHVLYRNSFAKGSKNTTLNTFRNKPFISIGIKDRDFEALNRSTQTYNGQLRNNPVINK